MMSQQAIQHKIIFRVDSSENIGSGHVMRCLALADELKKQDAKVIFICRDHKGDMIDYIEMKGFTVFHLPASTSSNNDLNWNKHAIWLDVPWDRDVRQTIGILETMERRADLLIVDHYALDHNWEQAIRPFVEKIMVIDDLADRCHDCDLLLDQNLGRDKTHYHHLVPENSTVLIGPKFALLRPEFAAFRDYSLQRRANPKLKHLMISMGGVDQINSTGQVLEAIKACALPDDLRITVVMGPNAPWLPQVKTLAEQLQQSMEVKVNVQNMAQLMADSDLAIGAAGSTSWERCCLGVPALVLIVAENQRESAMAIERKGCVKLIDCSDVVPKQLSSILSFFMNSTELIRMSRSSSSVVDGKGTGRVLRTLFESVKPIQTS